MAAVATNLIAGAATLWTADFGATEPTDTTVGTTDPASPWVDAGGTDDGVTLTVSREYFELRMDQVTMTPARRRTKTDATVATNLAEGTLANWALALSQPSSDITTGGTTNTAWTGLELDTGAPGAEPPYKAIILRGWAPNGKKRNVIVRKALSTDEVESAYKKDDQTLIPVTFAAHWVSASIKPVRWVDSTPA